MKSIFASKTIWGAVLMIIPPLLSIFGVSSDDASQGVSMASELIDKAIAFIGFVVVIWGRVAATKPVTLLGG